MQCIGALTWVWNHKSWNNHLRNKRSLVINECKQEIEWRVSASSSWNPSKKSLIYLLLSVLPGWDLEKVCLDIQEMHALLNPVPSFWKSPVLLLNKAFACFPLKIMRLRIFSGQDINAISVIYKIFIWNNSTTIRVNWKMHHVLWVIQRWFYTSLNVVL